MNLSFTSIYHIPLAFHIASVGNEYASCFFHYIKKFGSTLFQFTLLLPG
ncbi:hypothetical protein C900_03526 [Fulvivirga imtechensis AK7]|uniref:Uncharacterized protein n=1 Tax=Fulvivirga imtechensis AK7 TaxID=1237149 RepID=L8JNX9_9BACT|nr:hypothetical protein C900_03526 [Fulvivirga imtechensis AK7]